jgi:hypothetical protein
MHENETYTDYCLRVKDVSSPYTATSGESWTPDDLRKLLELFDHGASKRELLAQFPIRRWQSIAKKLRVARGKEVQLPVDSEISNRDTIYSYCQKIGEVYAGQVPQLEVSSLPSSQSMPGHRVWRRSVLAS